MTLERIDLPRRRHDPLECIVFDGGTDDESIRIKEKSSEFYASGDRIVVSDYSTFASVELWSGSELVTSVNTGKALARRFEVELGRSAADYLAD